MVLHFTDAKEFVIKLAERKKGTMTIIKKNVSNVSTKENIKKPKK